NHNICDILTSCSGSAVYMSNLASAWGLAQDDHYCNVNPSLPNYLCLTGGTDFGCNGYDGGPNSNACTNAAWTAPNIVDRLGPACFSESSPARASQISARPCTSRSMKDTDTPSPRSGRVASSSRPTPRPSHTTALRSSLQSSRTGTWPRSHRTTAALPP